MALLTKCVYGVETNPKKTPFGLINGQYRIGEILQNAGWFNGDGERLGSGDLSMKDLENISKHISSLEIFFALTELDSSWDLPSHLNRTEPGIEYVVQKAVWIAAKSNLGSSILRIRDDISKPEEAVKDDVKYLRLPRRELYASLVKLPQPPAAKPPVNDPLKELKKQVLTNKTKPVSTKTIKKYSSYNSPILKKISP